MNKDTKRERQTNWSGILRTPSASYAAAQHMQKSLADGRGVAEQSAVDAHASRLRYAAVLTRPSVALEMRSAKSSDFTVGKIVVPAVEPTAME